jgi:hypothetical protein
MLYTIHKKMNKGENIVHSGQQMDGVGVGRCPQTSLNNVFHETFSLKMGKSGKFPP